MARRTNTAEEKAMSLIAARTVTRGRPKKWENYTNEEKRIAIAYDVLQSILAGVIAPEECTYVGTNSIRNDVIQVLGIHNKKAQDNLSVQQLLKDNVIKGCPACQLGSAYLSLVRFENKVLLGNPEDFDFFEGLENTDSGHRQEPGNSRKRLAEIFGHVQLSLLECAFEQANYFESDENVPTPEEKKRKAVDFGRKYPDKDDRMLEIWMNVIKNKGVFKP
jgi:hypothetical protein